MTRLRPRTGKGAYDANPPEEEWGMKPCLECYGTGGVCGPCPICHGAGEVPREEAEPQFDTEEEAKGLK